MLKGVTQDQIDFILFNIRKCFPDSEIVFFGSRVYGQPKQYSDLDICIDHKSPLSLSKLSFLEEIFAESSLPFKVDISDFHRISKEFQNLVMSKGLKI